MAERWLAWCVDGLALGLIWSDDVEKHEWEWSTVNFDRRSVTLDPGSTAEMAPFYIYAGPGDWADVRHAWTRLAGRTPQRAQSLQPEHKLEFGFDPSPIITLSDQVDVALYADNVRELPVDGQIVVEMPQGWRAEPTEFVLNELKHKHPLNAPLRLDASGASIGAYTGQLHLKGNRFDATQTFTLIRLGDETAQVRMTEMVGGDYPLFLLDNGYSRWHIAPSYHAGVVTWEEGNSDINHLLCAYPQEGGAELSWLKPWFGGIHPMLMPDGEDEGWPGKLHEEKFIPEPCQRTEHGVNWSGLRLCAQLDREQFRGLRAEVEYLTAGQSNLLRVVYRLINETGIYRLVTPGLLAFLQPDGRYDNSALHADGVELKRAPIMTWIVVGNWGAATNPESGKTLVVVKETPGAWLELSDWAQDGGHVFGFNRTCIPPQSQTEMIVYLALTDTLQDARRYAALGRYG
jgi:hypothetical protein